MRRRLFSLCIGACVVAMAACGIPAGGTSDSVTGGGVSSSPPVQSESGSDGGSEEKAASVTIYVGTDGEYAEFPVEYTGERLETGQVPVTEVLSAMAKITLVKIIAHSASKGVIPLFMSNSVCKAKAKAITAPNASKIFSNISPPLYFFYVSRRHTPSPQG